MSYVEYQPLSLLGRVGEQGCIFLIFLCLSVPPTRREVLMIVHKGAWFPEVNTAQTKPAYCPYGAEDVLE